MRFFTNILFLGALVCQCTALATIQKAGRYLYNSSDGSRFYIKGVAYQQQGTLGNNGPGSFPEPTDFIDPLADSTICSRDLPNLQALGVNTLRIYNVNASLNHDACVQMFANAGMYLLIDLGLPVNGSIDRASPAWTTNLLDLFVDNIDAFVHYPNILGFNVGNEVANSVNSTDAAPFVKAAARDVKAYLKSLNSPALVGYSSVDGDRSWRIPLATFLSCDSEADSIDLYGLNNYEWCGNSSYNNGYNALTADYAGYNIPAYFSEFGCKDSPPRLFTEVAAIFGSLMAPVFSGGIAFSYFPATVPGFALVNISADGSTATPNDDFGRLQAQYANVTFINSPTQSSAGQTNYPQCAQENSTFLASSTLPPTPSDQLCSCINSTSFSCLFTPQTTNTTDLIGPLLGDVCGLLANAGSNCDVIAGSGSAGKYGELAFCDPAIKVSWAFSAFYEITARNAASCNFAGNATINASGPSSSAAADAAANSCIASAPSGTFVPTAGSAVPQVTQSQPSSSGGGTQGGAATSQVAGITRALWLLPVTLAMIGGGVFAVL